MISGLWCNGNTSDSGSDFLGSSPSSPTITIDCHIDKHFV